MDGGCPYLKRVLDCVKSRKFGEIRHVDAAKRELATVFQAQPSIQPIVQREFIKFLDVIDSRNPQEIVKYRGQHDTSSYDQIIKQYEDQLEKKSNKRMDGGCPNLKRVLDCVKSRKFGDISNVDAAKRELATVFLAQPSIQPIVQREFIKYLDVIGSRNPQEIVKYRSQHDTSSYDQIIKQYEDLI